MPLASFLFQPALFAAMLGMPTGQSLMGTSAQFDALNSPVAMPRSPMRSMRWNGAEEQQARLPLAAPWMALRQSDPSLRLTAWSQVLNVARLGVFVIPLRNDPAERTNILLAARAVDEAVVAPGSVFSFNKTVGERTPEKGYEDGLMFSQGQVIRGTGGGICLVSTGLYNAALHAGMGLIERHPHSGIVGYAPPGCDASVVYGAEDMQFQNTTDSPVVVKADIEDDRVVIGLFGRTPPAGRQVLVRDTHLAYIPAPVVKRLDPSLPADSRPIVTQKPRMGYDVTVERVIMQGPQVVASEEVASEHRAPRPMIMRVPVSAAAPIQELAAPSLFGFPERLWMAQSVLFDAGLYYADPEYYNLMPSPADDAVIAPMAQANVEADQ